MNTGDERNFEGRGEERNGAPIERRPDDPVIAAALAAVEGASPNGDAFDEDLAWEYELAAGAVYLGFHGTDATSSTTNAMPAGALDRIADAVRSRTNAPSAPALPFTTTEHVAAPSAVEPTRYRGEATRLWAMSGWIAAAAIFLALVIVRNHELELARLAGVGDPSERLASLIDTAGDVSISPWSRDANPNVGGDVVWSDERNEGYMRIDGLDVNDPDVSQYQLWIFRGTDPGAEPHPVDGGVFDIGADGSAVVPIDAKLDVGRAGLFVVTKEPPGGVVVSDRESIVLVSPRV